MKLSDDMQAQVDEIVERRLVRERNRYRQQIDQLRADYEAQLIALRRRIAELEFIERLVTQSKSNVLSWRTWFGFGERDR